MSHLCCDTENNTFDGNTTEGNKFLGSVADRYIYGSVMFFILTIGFAGNAFTIFVFLRKRRRSQIVSPYILNLAVADLFIVIFGYPVAISANATNNKILANTVKCTWSAFVNGSVGITSIATLTEVSVVMCYSITRTISPQLKQISTKNQFLTLGGAWLYGIIAMIPPVLGWSKFVPGSAEISCSPDWTSQTAAAISYNTLLIVVGFIAPLFIISKSYYRIYRSLALDSMLSEQIALTIRRRKSQLKVVRMIAASVFAFLLSWSPYCVVCVIEMIKHERVLNNRNAEIPELMAKASVVYNPFIYIAMNRDIRKTAKKLVSCSTSRETSLIAKTLPAETILAGLSRRNFAG